MRRPCFLLRTPIRAALVLLARSGASTKHATLFYHYFQTLLYIILAWDAMAASLPALGTGSPRLV